MLCYNMDSSVVVISNSPPLHDRDEDTELLSLNPPALATLLSHEETAASIDEEDSDSEEYWQDASMGYEPSVARANEKAQLSRWPQFKNPLKRTCCFDC